jgi:hypothetical protein
MFYKDIKHHETFMELINEYGKGDSDEYASALYILTIPEIYENTKSDINSSGIDFDLILNKYWPESLLFLINVAKVLFKSKGDVSLSDFLLLDPNNYKVFQQSMLIRNDVSQIKN